MADAGGAEKLGERLMGEVEECGLGELLASLRTLILPPEQHNIFNIPELDTLLPIPQPAPPIQPQQQIQRSDHDDTWNPHLESTRTEPQKVPSKKTRTGVHVIELVSPPHAHHPSPAGKTSLVHLILTHAILPRTLSNVPLSGLNSTAILFDPLHHFSVPFLATTALAHTTARFKQAGHDLADAAVQREITTCVEQALRHVHIFRPASWDSLIATLKGLEAYLFDGKKHASSHRAVHSLVLEDLDAFVPGLRNGAPAGGGGNAVSTASAQVTRCLVELAGVLSCAVITTGRAGALGSFRPSLPLGWPVDVRLTRLAVRRVEVLRFAPGISVQEAEGEREQRWDVVARGRFEAWKVGQPRDGEGFVFRVRQGVSIERER